MKLWSILCLLGYFLQVFCVPKPIVGGRDAPKNTYKYQVSIQIVINNSTTHFCGGSIIAERWVLTAGHCMQYIKELYNFMDIQILTGTISQDCGGVTYGVEKVIFHENWDSSSVHNDIALIRTNQTIVFNRSIGKIRLATKRPPDGSKVTFTGWGYTSNNGVTSNTLQVLKTLTVLNLEKCIAMNPLDSNVPELLVTKTNICLIGPAGRGQSGCLFDSGGPSTYAGQQVGILSFKGETCGSDDPDVHTCVPDYIKWIASKIGIVTAVLENVFDIYAIL